MFPKLTSHVLLQEINFRNWNWRSGGALLGLGLGITAPLIGSLFTLVSWLTGPTWHGFSIQRDGTILLFLTIPFLLLGGHCLDLLEKSDKGEPHRLAKERRKGGQ